MKKNKLKKRYLIEYRCAYKNIKRIISLNDEQLNRELERLSNKIFENVKLTPLQ